MEDSQVPLNGDGDGHEDAAGEEDVVEGVEEVWEEVVMNLGGQTIERSWVGNRIFKSTSDTFSDTNNKEEEVEHCESDEKVVEVALETLVTEDSYCKNIGAHT